MRKFLPLLLCLSLSILTVARATKPAHVFAPETDAKALVNDANTEEEAASDDDDSTTGGSNDEGEDVNDDEAMALRAMRVPELMMERTTMETTTAAVIKGNKRSSI